MGLHRRYHLVVAGRCDRLPGQVAKSTRKLTPASAMPVHSLLVHVNMGGKWETGYKANRKRGGGRASWSKPQGWQALL